MKPIITTSKKIKVIGHEEYINKDGDTEEFQVVSIGEADANFHKIWLGHIIQALEIIGNKKIKVLNFIVSHMEKANNTLTMTQEQIAEKCGVARKTVNETLKVLIEAGYILKQLDGVYVVHPNMIFKGGYSKRMNVLLKYYDLQNQQGEAEEEVTAAKEEPIPTPTKEEEQPTKDVCPKCGKELRPLKTNPNVLGCPNYKKCGYNPFKKEGISA